MTIKLIIGLRNPGSAYEHTRHNAGGWFATALCHRYEGALKVEKKLHAELANLEIKGHACKVLFPLTFMNHSGLPAREVSQFYRIEANEILVVHDELDLPAGRIKLKTGGGHGGHNGLRDLIAQLGSSNFHRLRIGIGHPGHKDLVLNYVLGKPSPQDRQLIIDAIDRGIAVMPTLLAGNMAAAMNALHS
ncbi:aminoacyl-tRNA hydrolase [Legionella jordanis]|uniref:Peptidyl-tRNA hydrolase n=1 Tax=Legionella jordanis TaxID=456 RepID=A0A0W0VAY8_9GAMM|nr:aminoacyl-tRNA hydrolase [Legionella jordanis]KTD16809.1 peptidyl-tRNA hydrolase [Legionella jordanis]RMX03666.1 aminoacyl-tRNA hydrolase [Legionella jordanis]RMX22273.1 aminoacyl-tRNA hydrolase [Legionella jordanis]VEH11724.1 peptidyl-tRNA hydrolase [Legionella jordanis]HAT8712964.1 aminoacyl-tRNA hydrolase [Legionella jordanis]